MFHVFLKGRNILPLLDVFSFRYQSSQSGYYYSLALLYPYWFFPPFLSIMEREVLKSPSMIIDIYVPPFSFVKFCFLYFQALFLFMTMTSLYIDFVVITKCPFFLVIPLFKKSILSQISIGTSTFSCMLIHACYVFSSYFSLWAYPYRCI